MIDVEAEGGRAAEFLLVDIPAEVPAGSFAMAFRHDPDSGELEGLPVVSIDGGVVRVPMLHFSEFFLSLMLEEMLTGDLTTGFVVGRDAWPFANRGSFAQPVGHSAGMTLSALYHFKLANEGPPVGAFGACDDNFRSTPGLPDDDRLALRLSGAVQAITPIDESSAVIHSWFDPEHIDPRLTPLTIAYAYWLTERPQVLHLDDGAQWGHSILAIGMKGNRVRIDDPNHPDRELALSFDPRTGEMSPYQTGVVAPVGGGAEADDGARSEADGMPDTFTDVYYLPVSDAIDWPALSGLWRQFKAGRVGETLFPAYGLSAQAAALRVTFEPQGKAVLYNDQLQAYDAVDGGGATEITLQADQTRVGFLIEGQVQDRPRWVDFRWITIQRGEPVATPTLTTLAGDLTLEDRNALPYLGLATESWQDSGATWTGCHFTYRLKNTHPSRDIAVMFYRIANLNFGGFVFDGWQQHYVLAPGETDQLVNMNDFSQGQLQNYRDYPRIGAVFTDSGCRWIYLDPGASSFPFEDLENACR